MRKKGFTCIAVLIIGYMCCGCVSAASFNVRSKSLKIYEKYDLKELINGYSESCTFSSSDASVAEVTKEGIVTTKKLGRATITISDGNSSNSINISSGYFNGIDLSSYNNTVNWNLVKKQGIDFVMIRAGYGWYDPEGVDYGRPFDCQVDAQLLNNMRGAIEYDIPFGVYHYSYADTLQKADQEADYLIQILDEYCAQYKDKMSLPVAYDVEEGKLKNVGKAALTNIAIRFCSRLYEAGYTPIIYANPDFLNNYLDLDKLNALAYDIWYAHWKDNIDYSNKVTISNTNLVPYMWQYSAEGSVEGANTSAGTIDLDLMYMKERVKVDVYDESGSLIDTIGADKGGKLDYYPLYQKEGYTVKFVGQDNIEINENTTFNNDSIINVVADRIAITSIKLNYNEINVDVIESSTNYELQVSSYTPEDAILNDDEIQYVSSNTEVAQVDENGKINIVGKGETKITASLKSDERIKDECIIKVNLVIKKGDITEDGIINATDAAIVLDKYKNSDATSRDFELADMNDDNLLNSTDAAIILDLYKNS